MIYLKCSKCGHLNEVNTQYLTFCAGCNKKLENNYASWQVFNPEGSFGDYKQQVCLTEEKANAVPPSAKKKLNKGKLAKLSLAGVLAITLFFAAGQYAVYAASKVNSSLEGEKISAAIIAQKWSQETYGIYGLSIETPVRLNRANLPLPANIRDAIEHMDVFRYESLKGIQILVSSIRYKQVVDSISLQGAANGSTNEARLQPGVTDFKYIEEPHNLGNIRGFLQKGAYRLDGQVIEFQNTGFVKELNLWQVWVAYSADDETGRKLADRIINSIKIDYSGK